MSIQKFEWGFVEWFEDCIDTLNIGISHVHPEFIQRPHVHYENEQWIYVLEGEGTHTINDEERIVKQGDNIYLPFNCIHATKNLKNVPLVELVISSPRKNNTFKIKEFSLKRYVEYKNSLYAAIDALNLEHDCPEHIPFFIRDQKGNIVFQSKIWKEDRNRKSDREIYKRKDHVIRMSLKVDDTVLGELYCDLNMLKEAHRTDLSESSISSIRYFLMDLSSSINSFCKFNNIQKSFVERKNQLKQGDMEKTGNLPSNHESISNNLKINFHFLFNTLNYMASLAFEQDNEELYQSITILGKLFRYMSDHSGNRISIADEISYLKNYIYLQKIRYKDNLEIAYDIDPNVLDSEIPINCLQPIIENAFSHGFMKFDGQKKIEIDIKKRNENTIQILLKNNGRIMDMSSIRKIQESLPKGENHGLMLVYDKLKLNYGDDFDLKIFIDGNKTVFEIDIPFRKISC